MSMTDTIADMLTRIRNAQKSKLTKTLIPHSKLKCSILNVLKTEGYIKDYSVNVIANNISNIEVELKYLVGGKPVINEIHRVSKPSRREYSSARKLPNYYNNMGIYILSTSSGVISDRQAHQAGIGGEIICKIF